MIPRPAYVTSGPHLSGYQVTLGYETLADAGDAHEAIAKMTQQPNPPLGGDEEKLAGLIAVRDALLVAGGADPSNGACRFSYWNLDKLNKAFDAALSTIKGEA